MPVALFQCFMSSTWLSNCMGSLVATAASNGDCVLCPDHISLGVVNIRMRCPLEMARTMLTMSRTMQKDISYRSRYSCALFQ